MKSVNKSLSIRTNNKTAQSVRASLDKATRQEETPLSKPLDHDALTTFLGTKITTP